MKVFFLNDSSSNPNWGDRAAALALRAMITEAGAEIGAGLTESELSRQSFYGTPVEDTDRSEPSPVAVVARKITRRLTSRLGPVRSKALDTGAVPRSWHDYPAALDAWRSHPEAWHLSEPISRRVMSSSCTVMERSPRHRASSTPCSSWRIWHERNSTSPSRG